MLNHLCMLCSAVDDHWSAFEHTLTPLEPGSSVSSFLSLIPWNNRTKASRQENHSSYISDVQKRHFSSVMPQQVFTSSESSIDGGRKSLFQMSTSPSVNAMGDDDTNAGVSQFPAVSCSDSRFLTNNSFDTMSITPAEAQTLKDANIVSGKQVLVNKDSEHSTNSGVQYSVNKSTKGKENIQPSGKQSELRARNTVDLSHPGIATCNTANQHSVLRVKSQESGGKDQWRSPPRRSANNAKNLPLAHSQLLQRDGRKERTVSDTNKDASNTNSDEAYKRTSSTPVKDRSPQQPIRFTRQRHGSSSDEAECIGGRKDSWQDSGEVLVRGSKIKQSVARLNERSLSVPAAQRTVSQVDNRDIEMKADFMEQSFAALSTGSVSNDSLNVGDTTFTSTTFMSLPRRLTTESVISLPDTVSSEVGTQTSFLLSSNDRKSNTRITSGM